MIADIMYREGKKGVIDVRFGESRREGPKDTATKRPDGKTKRENMRHGDSEACRCCPRIPGTGTCLNASVGK